MKRFNLWALSLLLLPAISYASTDRLGNERGPIWRSSSTCNAFNFGILATSAAIVHAISVDSGAVNQGGSQFLATFNSNVVPTAVNFGTFLTTATLTATSVFGGAPLSLPPYAYDVYFTSGIVVNKVGAACTTIFWDFPTPKTLGKDPFFDNRFPYRP